MWVRESSSFLLSLCQILQISNFPKWYLMLITSGSMSCDRKKKSLIGFFSYKAHNGYFFSPISALHMCLSILSPHQPGCGCWDSVFCFSSYPHQMIPAARDSKVITQISNQHSWNLFPEKLARLILLSIWSKVCQVTWIWNIRKVRTLFSPGFLLLAIK